MNTKTFGLLGEKLSHSRSPQIHAQLADYEYRLFPMPREELDAFFAAGDFMGLNVTIPYKETVLPYCSKLTDVAKRMGCVNTITWDSDGTLIGDNSDYYGFCYTLSHYFPDLSGKKALVLGSGGASKTVRIALADAGCREVVIISRSGENNYENLSRHADADFIVNTTPVGMYPNNGKAPLSLKQFPKLLGVADLIYNPIRTALLLEAKELGIPYCNGLMMLVAQAALSSSRFTGLPLDEARIDEITARLHADETNLILIGMPGCGKSTLGKLLAEEFHREFLDTDELITAKTGRTPAQIITEDGEAAFRTIESAVIAETGALTGKVISTGGGVITREENYAPLAQNGILLFINRDPSLLPTEGRPLSADSDAVMRLYEQRLPLYRKFCDAEILAADTINDTYTLLTDTMMSRQKRELKKIHFDFISLTC